MPFTHGHALLIGVGSYRFAPSMDVPVTVRDAEAIGEILTNPQFCGYPAAQVRLLHDADATKQGVLAALDDLAARTTGDDTVVLFYCGHGDYGDDGSYYLTTHDTRIEKHRVVNRTGVSQQELLAKVKALSVRRVLLVFNACHSGEVSPTLGAGETLNDATLPEDTAAALLHTGEGRVIITACREGQLSYIGNGAITIFTQALVDGLRGKGVPNRRGYISAFDLYTATYDTVSETVAERYNTQQEPELTILKGVGPMAISLYRGATALGAFEAPTEPEDRPTVRQVSPRQSERSFQQIMVGYQQLGDRTEIATGGGAFVGHSVSTGGGDFIGRDKHVGGDEVRGNKISRHTDTGGGTYYEGSDQRQGAFISGGTSQGPIIGVNSGTVSTSYGGAAGSGGTPTALRQAQAALQEVVNDVQRRGDTDLAADLKQIGDALHLALQAEHEGKTERRASKLVAAQQQLQALVSTQPQLQNVLQLLARA